MISNTKIILNRFIKSIDINNNYKINELKNILTLLYNDNIISENKKIILKYENGRRDY